MIQIIKEHDLSCPIITCDKCGKVINKNNEGNIFFDWCLKEKDISSIKFICKKCSYHYEELPLATDLEEFLKQLNYNYKYPVD